MTTSFCYGSGAMFAALKLHYYLFCGVIGSGEDNICFSSGMLFMLDRSLSSIHWLSYFSVTFTGIFQLNFCVAMVAHTTSCCLLLSTKILKYKSI